MPNTSLIYLKNYIILARAFKKHFAPCLWCDSFDLKTKSTHFCDICFIAINSEKLPLFIEQKDHFHTMSLLVWTQKKDCGPMIKKIKGQGQKDKIEALAQILSKKILLSQHRVALEFTNSRNKIFIPAPGRENSPFPSIEGLVSSTPVRALDHAENLAASLCSIWGGALYHELQRTNKNEQKSLDRKQRKNCHFERKHNVKITNSDFVIFTDDVITTGQTALAAYTALGRPRHFIVISLTNRILDNSFQS